MDKYIFSEKPEEKRTDKIPKNPNAQQNLFFKSLPSLISVAVIFIAIALIWTDIRIQQIFTWKFASDSLAFLLLFYTMFFSGQENGMNGGRLSHEYSSLKKQYHESRDVIRKEGAELDLPDFCEFYISKEIKDYRTRILLSANMQYSEWKEKYSTLDDFALLIPLKRIKFEKEIINLDSEYVNILHDVRKLSGRKRNAIMKACLAKPIDFTPDVIMLDDGEHAFRSPIAEKSIEQHRRQKNIFALIRITIMLFCTISLTGDVVTDVSVPTLIYGIVKIISLVYTGYNGYNTGFKLYTEFGVRRLNDQINLIAMFFKWRCDVLKKPLKSVSKSLANGVQNNANK